jgi:WD40 repeat protein
MRLVRIGDLLRQQTRPTELPRYGIAVTGARLQQLHGHKDWIRSITFSPDSVHLLTASKDTTARLWDVTTGQSVTFAGHTKGINSAVFNANGQKVLTASDDGTARIWDAETGDLIIAFHGHTGSVNNATFSFDDRLIATASSDHTARIWDTRTGHMQAIAQHEYEVETAVFNPKREQVLTTTTRTSPDKSAYLWNSASGELIATLDHKNNVRSARYSPDGDHIVTASDDRSAIIWDALTGNKSIVLQGHTAAVNTASFSMDGRRIVTASKDNTARIWDTQTGASIATFIHLDAVISPEFIFDASVSGVNTGVEAAEFSADGQRILTVPNDYTVRVWDAQNSTLRDSNGIYRVEFSPNWASRSYSFKRRRDTHMGHAGRHCRSAHRRLRRKL